MRACTFLMIIAFIVMISFVAHAQSEVPPDSMDALQNILGITRDKLWEKNDEFWHRGEFERCIAMMRLITQIDPHDVEAYDDGAWLMQNQLRDDEGEAFLIEGLAVNTDSYDIYFDLGYFYYMHEQFDESVDYLAAALTFEAPMTAWHTFAHALEHAGYVESALSIWALRNIVDPENPTPQMQIERILNGKPPSGVPGMVSRARQERKAKAGLGQN